MNRFYFSIVCAIVAAILSSYVVSREVKKTVVTGQSKSIPSARAKFSLENISIKNRVQPPAAAELCDECEEPLESIFVKADRLSYNGYEVVRLYKTVIVEDVSKKYSYAVLKKNGKVIAEFDKAHSPVGNKTRFGLFPLLGGNENQLIVEQLSNRIWEYWIVELDPQFRLIYSTGDSMGRELRPFDIDGDGVFEISQSLITFWFFDRLDNPRSPLTRINFKYDNSAKRYLPANHLYLDYALEGAEKKIELLSSLNTERHRADPVYLAEYLGAVMDVMLRYAYAGKENDAWTFFDQNYLLHDKQAMRSRIEGQFKGCSLYREIYNR